MKTFSKTQACPCGQISGHAAMLYQNCCGRWLESDTPAPDAHSLMRSRYSAFGLERGIYLLQTWHASTRPATLEFDPGVKWLGLDVHSHRVLDANHAEVEFVARQKSVGAPALRLHERSRFVREAGRWYYMDGDLQ